MVTVKLCISANYSIKINKKSIFDMMDQCDPSLTVPYTVALFDIHFHLLRCLNIFKLRLGASRTRYVGWLVGWLVGRSVGNQLFFNQVLMPCLVVSRNSFLSQIAGHFDAYT